MLSHNKTNWYLTGEKDASMESFLWIKIRLSTRRDAPISTIKIGLYPDTEKADLSIIPGAGGTDAELIKLLKETNIISKLIEPRLNSGFKCVYEGLAKEIMLCVGDSAEHVFKSLGFLAAANIAPDWETRLVYALSRLLSRAYHCSESDRVVREKLNLYHEYFVSGEIEFRSAAMHRKRFS